MPTAADPNCGPDETSPLNLGGLVIEGPDAAPFLQGYLTSDTERLSTDRSQRTALTTLKGRVLANGWAVARTHGVLLLLAADMVAPVTEFLKKYLAFSKSKARTLNAAELAETLAGIELPDIPEPQQPLEPQLLQARLPLVTRAISDQFLPQMLGLTDAGAVNFSKGCYLGQEIVARAEHRGAVKRKLHAFRATPRPGQQTSAPPVPGAPVHGDGSERQIGTVVLVDAVDHSEIRLLAVVGADSDALDTPLTTANWLLTPLS